MSITTTPVPAPPKKRGMGCFGCGCVVVILLIVLFFLLVGSITYVVYKSAINLTADTQPAIPTFDGGDDAYQKARGKLADFDHDVTNHQAATINLSANEINTLIAHDPDIAANHIAAFVTLTDSAGEMQVSFPTDAVSDGILKGRYATFDITFSVHYNASTRSVEVTPHTLQVGDHMLVGAKTGNDQAAQQLMASYVPVLNQQLNLGIRKNADGAALLNQAKSIEIQGGQLVIQTQ